MLRYLLDTNMVIYVLKRRPLEVLTTFNANASRMAVSSITSKRKLSDCQQRRNHRIAKVRARVEHVFAAIAQMGSKLVRTIGHARAAFGMTMMALC
jgi:predicted nucleic acid-binding protein